MNPVTQMIEHELQNTHPDDYGIIIAKLSGFIREKLRTMHGWSDELIAMEMALYFRYTDDEGKRVAA